MMLTVEVKINKNIGKPPGYMDTLPQLTQGYSKLVIIIGCKPRNTKGIGPCNKTTETLTYTEI